MSPADPDMFAKPDPDTLIQLSWKREVGWLAGDLWMGSKEVESAPRVVLKRQIEAAAREGYRMKTGVEASTSSSCPTAPPSRTRATPRTSPATTSRR
jgi:glutamine synthetase